MKKTVFILVAIASLWQTNAFAQDTMEYLDPRYMFNRRIQRVTPITSALLYILNPPSYWQGLTCETINFYSPGSEMFAYFTKDTIKIYGVAITMTEIDSAILREKHFQATLAHRPTGVFTFIDTVEWVHGSIERFRYYIWGEGVRYDSIVPVYEFYFDQPHIVTDSFFVGFYMREQGYYIPPIGHLYCSLDTGYFYFRIDDQRMRNPPVYPVRQGFSRKWSSYFPILQPCRTPAAPRMTAMHDTVRIAWDEQPDSVQLAIIPLLQAGGDCIYDVTDTVLYLNGIPDGIYLASIRTKCTRNMYWSLWSDSTSITVDNTLSVATPAPNVTLSPNPTGGTLTIRCAAEMTKVELYDMQGRLALSATPTGSETMLDLQPLPTGSYVAVITTSQGTATRKVERQ